MSEGGLAALPEGGHGDREVRLHKRPVPHEAVGCNAYRRVFQGGALLWWRVLGIDTLALTLRVEHHASIQAGLVTRTR